MVCPIQVDQNDKLLDPPSPETPRKLLIDDVELYKVESKLIDQFVPEAKEIFAKRELKDTPPATYEDAFRSTRFDWKFNPIADPVIMHEKKRFEKSRNLDARKMRMLNRERQKLYRW